MLTHFFRLAVRNLKRQSLFTAINVLGLAIGLASVLVIVAFVRDEMSYDKFHSRYERIHRITLDWLDDGKFTQLAAVEPPLSEGLNGKLSSIEHFVRIFPLPAHVSSGNNDKSKEAGFCFADSVFFRVFDFEFISGDQSTALNEPMSVVLTESKAIRYFGSTDAIGKDVVYETDRSSFTFHVTGVIKDFPRQSHFQADFLASFHSLNQVMPWYNSWYYPQMHTYVLVREGASIPELEQQLNIEARKIHPKRIAEGERTYHLQGISDIHLRSNLQQEWSANSSMSTIYIFITIACFVLVIASINFMNLSTAQADKRAREVGVRKVMGAIRHQLIIQFIGEAMLVTSAAFTIGFALAEWVLLSGLNQVLGRDLTIGFIYSGNWLPITTGMLSLIGICSGIYPAFFLSRYKPSNTLKGLSEPSQKVFGFRSALVIFQFAISTVLLIFTWIVIDQNGFMINKDPGFRKDQLVAIHLNDDEAQRQYTVFKNSLLSSSEIAGAALCSGIPGRDEFFGFSIKIDSKPEEIAVKTLGVDEDFVKTFGLNLIAGRDFSFTNKSDEEHAFIINEAAARSFGWVDALEKEIIFTRYTDKREEKKGKVIGVVKDFHFESLHHEVEPLLIYINRHTYFSDYLAVRVGDITPVAAVELLEEKWSQFIPDKPLDLIFLDNQLNQFYQSEIVRSKILRLFSFLSILVSCLGLFGLATFAMRRRRREIGIRKVMGANFGNLARLLSLQFLKLILIANMIAWPVAWYLSTVWLENFAYHITPGAKVFVASFVATMVIAFITIAVQTFQTARVNPVNTLREQ